MELIIIRHGRPEKVQDSPEAADPPLTAVGHAQAEAVADWLEHEHLDAIYVSPMARARQTSAPLEVLKKATAIVEPRIQEFDKNENSYIPMEEMMADKVAWRAYLAENAGMDMTAFADEVVSGIKDIIADNRGNRVAVVCHGGVINIWAAHVLGLGPSMFFAPDYTSINRFMASSSGTNSLVSLNDVGHFRTLPHLQLL